MTLPARDTPARQQPIENIKAAKEIVMENHRVIIGRDAMFSSTLYRRSSIKSRAEYKVNSFLQIFLGLKYARKQGKTQERV